MAYLTNHEIAVLLGGIVYPYKEGVDMLYIGIQLELPRRKKKIARPFEKSVQKIVTISLVNPPLSYRTKKLSKPKVVKFCI